MIKPHDYQQKCINEVIEKFKDKNSLVLQSDTGSGKCLGKGTPILMYDGTIKKVEDVIVGDLIMGDDSTSRKVLSLARGVETMYKITPAKGESFIVNESHILSLKVTGIKKGLTYNSKKYFKGDVIDISVKDYLKTTNQFKHCTKQYRVPIEYAEKELLLDPYLLGLWLGDGSSRGSSITTMDEVIIDYLDDFVNTRKLNSRIEIQEGNKSIIYHISSNFKRNGVLSNLRELNLLENKHIPLIYKTSSREQRLQLLAGILDSDGHLNKGSGYDIIFKNETLANDLLYLCRSLGFSAYLSKQKKGCWYKGEYKSNIYNRITISGDCSIIPVKLERNKANERKSKKDVLVVGFKIEKLEEDNYYGFEITGNRRFVLGDFTVTHNTVMFSFISKHWSDNKKGKVLILCNRSELVDQSAETLTKIGLTYEKITPKTRRVHHMADVYICMVETLYRRLLSNPKYLMDVSLIIADECHYMSFPKIYSFFPRSKILGVTATPILLGRDTFYKCERCNSTSDELGECCGMEMYEWTKPKKLSDTYEDIVVGPSIDYLIEMGQLVREINFVKQTSNLSKLKIDSSGDFSNKSQDEVFGDADSIFNVLLNYEQIAKGKRTVIFNNSTKTNIKVYEDFKKAGHPVKMYDSVNTTDETRQEIVKWFKNTEGAILCNVATFIAGFDARNIECIILNVATMSLAKYLQAVGRGGRSCSEIYKPNFIVIDSANNLERFGNWSDPTRDWRKIFFEGIGKPKAKREAPLSVQECKECGMLFTRSESICPNCGWKVPIPPPRDKVLGDEILAPIDKIPLPNGKKIIDYTLSRGEGKAFAFKVLTEQIIDLFRFNLVSKAQYLNNKRDGRLQKRLSDIIRPVYFAFINQPEFKDGANRTLKWTMKKIEEKLDKYYNID